jgi:hypothetical protein
MATKKWPSKDEYLRIRAAVAQSEEGDELIKWAEKVKRPNDADDLALRLAWTVITSGFSYRQGKIVYDRVAEALRRGEPIYPTAFGHQRKARAIEQIWRDRESLFERFKGVETEQQASVWCEGIPYVRGPAVSRHAMRDLGAVDVAKPDRLMLRIAERARQSVADLCARLAKVTGNRIGTVDLVLWYAASVGIIPGISRRSARNP